MSLMSDIDVPTISIIIGEGGSAAALSLAISDKSLMLKNAIYSPISPEEASELLYKDKDKKEKAVAVIDSKNEIVGSINPTKIINTVFGGRKNNN